jgi:hypothetical protein
MRGLCTVDGDFVSKANEHRRPGGEVSGTFPQRTTVTLVPRKRLIPEPDKTKMSQKSLVNPLTSQSP